MPAWLHELAALTTVGLASGWLAVRWFEIGKPRAAVGCSRCEHNPASGLAGELGVGPERRGGASTPDRARRSAQLRVLD